MPKKLATDSILNELKGASAFFQRPDAAQESAKPPKETSSSIETERSNGSTERFDRTVQTNGSTKKKTSTVLAEIETPLDSPAKRTTSRYSFEIYDDQKQTLEEVSYLYKKKTGKKLSSSRIIRDALDEFLDALLEKLKES